MEQQPRQHRSPPRAAGSRSTLPEEPDREAILVLAPQPFYEDRGTPIALRQVLEALGQLGHSVDVLTYPIGRSVELPGVRFFRVANPFRWSHVPIGLSVRKLLLDLYLIPAAWRRLRSRRYRAIHAVEEAAFPAVALGRLCGVPVVYDMQSSLPEQLARHRIFGGRLGQGLLKAAERWLLRRVNVVVTSTGLASHVAGVVPGARVREWRFPAADPAITTTNEAASLRLSLAIPDHIPVVVYSGTFAAYQGLPDLVAAIPLVLHQVPEVVFVLVGADGLDGEKLAGVTEEVVQSGNLRVIERQPREHVPAYLAMADLLVSPRAYGSNLPLKIFDYLAAGKPIVATDVPAHRTVLEGRAELVEPSAEALARAIAELLLDRERAGRLADEARAYAERKLGWMGFVRAVAALYDEVGAPSHGVSADRAAAATRHHRASALG
jgi:glycosyltransferase involved in cell wall biosynthesis